MSEMLKKYEISVWEDELITLDNGDSYYKERKIAIIGSDSMTARNRVFSPVLTENVNGEKTLTFSLQHRYFDDRVGDFIDNPIQKWLINERKVKLFYDDKWYDFIIKECNESSEEEVFNYVAKDIFVNELSKQGYGIEFNQELNNNVGTIIELGEETVKDTDWTVDKDNCDLLRQTVDEPLYECTTASSFEVINVDTEEIVTIDANEKIYVFYNYIANKDGTYLQFLRDSDSNSWSYDDNDVITGINYRYNGTLTIDENSIKAGELTLINIGELYTTHKGYRLVYQPRAIYDSVMEQYVELYKADLTGETQEIYKATTTDYSTSTLVMSYVSNGTDFDTDDKRKTVVGWDSVTYVTDGTKGFNDLSLATYPPIDTSKPLLDLSKLSSLSSYLEVDFKDKLDNTSDADGKFKNAIFNSGIMDHGSTIGSISKDEEYAFRIRVGAAEKGEKPINLDLSGKDDLHLPIKGYIAFYKTANQTINGTKYSVKTFDSKDIIFNFNTEFNESPKVITGGKFDSDEKTAYIIGNVVQTPSLKYYYQVENDNVNYVWNPDEQKFVPVDSYEGFLKYYINTAKAKQTVTNNKLQDPLVRIGIFLFTNDKSTFTNKCLYIEDVEIFKCIKDAKGEIILPGNVPTSAAITKESYYLKPKSGADSGLINTYSTKAAMAADLYISEDDITQVYNNKCEKILAIEESKSNCFNILQTLCETFECWLKLSVEHEKNGAIKLDENHKPIKKIAFKEFVGKDNVAGFKYGINLNSIERNLDSNEIVTKLIVAESQSDYTENGILSIAQAKSNPLGQPFIYNLDYYVQNGLIKDKEAYLKDLNTLYDNITPIDSERRKLESEYSKAQIALVNARSQATVYVETEETAQKTYAEALEAFRNATGSDYSDYLETNPDDIDDIDTVTDIIGDIYAAASLLNNVGGVKTTAEQEYQQLKLECDGAQEYSIVVSTTKGADDYEESENYTSARTRVSIDDYLVGFKFSLKRVNEGEVEVETYETDLNTKEFDIDNDVDKVPFDTLIINAIPEKYKLQYTSPDDGQIYIVGPGEAFQIYDKVKDEEMIRRFKLVPDEEFAESNPGYQKRIDKLTEQEKQYIKDFESKYRQYIQEGTWSEESYIDSNLYYFDALQVSKTSAFPQVSYTINVSEVSEIEGRENYDFEIGDKTYVEDVEFFGYTESSYTRQKTQEEIEYEHSLYDEIDGYEFTDEETFIIQTPVKEEVILSEIEWHLDNPSENTITVQNYKTQFEDLFQRISAAVQTVEYNAGSYSRAAGILDKSGQIDKDLLAKSLAGIAGTGGFPLTASSTIRITDDGILANNLTNPKNYVKLSGSGISASSDGGRTWTDIVTANGITTSALTAGTIDTQLISIMDGDNTSFRWDKNGLSAYGFNEYDGYDLTSFVRMDKYGLYGIKNGDEYVVSSLDNLKDKAHFSLTWDGFRIKNTYGNGYVDISSENDFRVVKTNGDEEITKIHIGAIEKDSEGNPLTYGIRINNDAGAPVMMTNDDGNLTVTGEINATSGIFNGEIVVGEESNKYILLSGNSSGDSIIASSDYRENSTAGWAINGAGDAIFNNVSVRGAIKTAVFEYSEIEAVGGAFLFRPSSSIKEAYAKIDYQLTEDTEVILEKNYYQLINDVYELIEVEEDDNFNPVEEGWYEELITDLVIITENNQLFKQNEWVKLSNCNSQDTDLLNNSGLTHIYKIINNPSQEGCVILKDAAIDFSINSTPEDSYEEVDNNQIIGTPVENELYEFILQYKAIENISDVIDPTELGLYEFNGTTYILSEDEVMEGDKTYYQPVVEYILTIDTIVDFNKVYYKFISAKEKYILHDLDGGALISFGYYDVAYGKFNIENNNPAALHLYELINGEYVLTTDTEPINGKDYYKELYENGVHNYGIGINSSDNYVGLPERAISLFESKIHPDRSVKVTYDYKGILGTLPVNMGNLVNNNVYQYMGGTQGIFTNNMYIGDSNQYLAFYTDENNNKQLKIKANQIVYEVVDNTEVTWEDKINEIETTPGPQGENAITVNISSQKGNALIYNNEQTVLTCTVIEGNGTDITNQVIRFTWKKKDRFGVLDNNWTRTTAVNYITISTSDIDFKAVFECEVEF